MTRIYRSQRDKKIFGLCGGLAEAFNIDATILRLVLVITAFFSGGAIIFFYVVASLVIPSEPKQADPYHDRYDDPYDYRYGETESRRSAGGRYEWNKRESAQDRDRIDDMMEDVEKKALQKEIEQLREKLRKYEQNEKGDS